MGLDNGIIYRGPRSVGWLGRRIVREVRSDCVEICYWRKMWGLRREIMGILNAKTTLDIYEYELTAENVRSIRESIVWYILHPKGWDMDNFWTYKEAVRSLFRDVAALTYLLYLMQRGYDSVYFYDSF